MQYRRVFFLALEEGGTRIGTMHFALVSEAAQFLGRYQLLLAATDAIATPAGLLLMRPVAPLPNCRFPVVVSSPPSRLRRQIGKLCRSGGWRVSSSMWSAFPLPQQPI